MLAVNTRKPKMREVPALAVLCGCASFVPLRWKSTHGAVSGVWRLRQQKHEETRVPLPNVLSESSWTCTSVRDPYLKHSRSATNATHTHKKEKKKKEEKKKKRKKGKGAAATHVVSRAGKRRLASRSHCHTERDPCGPVPHRSTASPTHVCRGVEEHSKGWKPREEACLKRPSSACVSQYRDPLRCTSSVVTAFSHRP